jgi:hypothetical protein
VAKFEKEVIPDNAALGKNIRKKNWKKIYHRSTWQRSLI